MDIFVLVLVGTVVGLTTVLFGFGGGFVTVPIITVVDAGFGDHTARIATATSALVMLVNAAVATVATHREVLRRLRGQARLLLLLSLGGAVGAGAALLAPEAVLRWGFVAYIAVTAADLLLRPGFLRPANTFSQPGIRARLGFLIGSVAALLGVGGSVMTVPLMRRSGTSLPVATALANPLTLAIAAPALVVTLFAAGTVPAATGLVGAVDVRAGLALLLGAVPVIVVLRQHPPRIPELVHSLGYVFLVVVAGVVVAVA